jgi:hypothetical protein
MNKDQIIEKHEGLIERAKIFQDNYTNSKYKRWNFSRHALGEIMALFVESELSALESEPDSLEQLPEEGMTDDDYRKNGRAT